MEWDGLDRVGAFNRCSVVSVNAFLPLPLLTCSLGSLFVRFSVRIVFLDSETRRRSRHVTKSST